ncbi:hypothetical protein MCHI_003515 [Candidatus Magnetoovum chiemensis]|nr:hypothetical protein MCHI_003515 [Candidatus Magnetoovum chiemensis]
MQEEGESNWVSILVLMEVGFKFEKISDDLAKDQSFNPCFNGSWVQIL